MVIRHIFVGNKKTFDPSFILRADAQIIIFSNDHLFNSRGKYKDRFHIIKVKYPVLHTDVCKFYTIGQPFNVRFDQNGYTIEIVKPATRNHKKSEKTGF